MLNKNNIIVLKKYGDLVFLGTTVSVSIEDVSGDFIENYCYRVLNFDSITQTLDLIPEGKANSSVFAQTSAVIRDSIKNMEIKKISIKQPSNKQYIAASSVYKHFESNEERNILSTDYQSNEALPNTIKIECDLREAEFGEGEIKFSVFLKKEKTDVIVSIINLSFHNYFNSVKNYIWKALGEKKIECTLTYLIVDGQFKQILIEDSILSFIDESILNKIDDKWIETEIVKSSSNTITSVDKIIEILNCSGKDQKWLLNKLFTTDKTRHYQHLSFLSLRHDINYFQLSFVSRPFSFVFVIKELDSLFVVWETYSTKEATYIWNMGVIDEEAFQNELAKYFEIILYLRNNNKLKYKKHNLAGFYCIEHNYQLPENGFEKWKTEFQSIVSRSL